MQHVNPVYPQPPVQPYGYAPAAPMPTTSVPPAAAYADLRTPSKVAQALLAFVLVWDFGLKRVLYGVVEASSSSYKELDAAYRDLATVLKGGDVAFRLAAVIAFLVFIHRVFTGMRRELGTTKYSPAAAVAGWFIPLANAVLPALIVGEAWKRKGGSPGFLVYAWWVGYVAFTVLTAWSFDRPHTRPGDVSALLLSTTGLVQLLTFGAWIWIVRELTRRCAGSPS